MKNSCVILACSIFSKDRLFVLREFLKSIEKNFSESDVYIGINYSSIAEVEEVIKEYNINCTLSRLEDESRYSQSDASAYQLALKLLKDSNKKYEYYWFVHTKSGVNSHSDYLRTWYIEKLIGRKTHIEDFLSHNRDFGSYGLLGLEFDENRNYQETDTEIHLFENIKTEALKYNHAPFFYIHSLYVVNRDCIQTFFDNISDRWFSSKLDRYYFEGVFPFVVSRSGYIPYLANRISCIGTDLKPIIDNWISKELSKSISVNYETSYHFNQLNPPM